MWMSARWRNWPMNQTRLTKPSSRGSPGSGLNSKNNCWRDCAMKMNPDSEKENVLLDAILQDENWQATNTAGKAKAVGAFRARQRFRQLARWACGAAALSAMLAGEYWLHRPTAVSPKITATQVEEPKHIKVPLCLTDEQLLASFPEGSCFIAEVDGRKELVFLDPKLERVYVARTGQSN